jgi:hypothetical protein
MYSNHRYRIVQLSPITGWLLGLRAIHYRQVLVFYCAIPASTDIALDLGGSKVPYCIVVIAEDSQFADEIRLN